MACQDFKIGAISLKRRRFLKIIAASGAWLSLPELAAAERSLNLPKSPYFRWEGEALGAQASMLLLIGCRKKAEDVIRLCWAEINRLERIFSLHHPGSAIRKLNTSGFLDAPPTELVQLLNDAKTLGEQSRGAFDITLQPLWKYLYYTEETRLDPALLQHFKALVDYRKLNVSNARIDFSVPGMQITLNGIAQGFISDRIAELLKNQGVDRVLVQLGESVGTGLNRENQAWKIGLPHPESGDIFRNVSLMDQALATSAACGTTVEDNPSFRHIIDPLTGKPACRFKSVSVVARSATEADGLSTALSVMDLSEHAKLISCYPGARAIRLGLDNVAIGS